MVARIQILRSGTAGNRPTGKQYGEPYVNVADNQLGVMDSSNVARDLIGVPMFSPSTSYAIGNAVNYQGKIYVATVAISPAAFNPAQWSQVATAATSISYGVGSQRGLFGSNNTTTPNTKMDFRISELLLRDSTGAVASLILGSPLTFTNDLNVTGAGGQDTSTAIPASNWLHYYWILTSNKATLQTIASLTAPSAGGPALPGGYSYVCYIGTFRWNSSPALARQRICGERVFWESRTDAAVLSGGTSGGMMGLNPTSVIPPNALSYQLDAYLYMGSGTPTDIFADLYMLGTGYPFYRIHGCVDANHLTYGQCSPECPNINQTLGYGIASGGQTVSLNLYCPSYRIANGA
jgi:hypothetical protein